MPGITPVGKGLDILDKGIGILGDNIEGEAKRQEMLTERLNLDTTSPFKLPHLIRPIAFIWAMALQTILSLLAIIMAFRSDPVDTTSILGVIGSQTAILTAIVGFYFSSRRAEKIMAKQATVDLEMVKEKAKVDIIRDKDKLKVASKMAGIELEEAETRSAIALREEKAESKQAIKTDKKEARQERRAVRKSKKAEDK